MVGSLRTLLLTSISRFNTLESTLIITSPVSVSMIVRRSIKIGESNSNQFVHGSQFGSEARKQEKSIDCDDFFLISHSTPNTTSCHTPCERMIRVQTLLISLIEPHYTDFPIKKKRRKYLYYLQPPPCPPKSEPNPRTMWTPTDPDGYSSHKS